MKILELLTHFQTVTGPSDRTSMKIVELLTDFQTVTRPSDCTRTYDPLRTLRRETKVQSRGRLRTPML
jgi:hypothetical protein